MSIQNLKQPSFKIGKAVYLFSSNFEAGTPSLSAIAKTSESEQLTFAVSILLM